jgi:hypothetical protein
MDRKSQGGRIGGSHFTGSPHWALAALAGVGTGVLLLYILTPGQAPPQVIINNQPAPPPVVEHTTKVRVSITDLDMARYGPPVVTIDGKTQIDPDDRFATGRQKRTPDAEAYLRCHEFGYCAD